MTAYSDANWSRSSFCGASAGCVDVRRDGDTIQVRDSKLGDESPAQVWMLAEWRELLGAIVRHAVHHPAVDWLTSYQAGEIEFGLHRHEKLTFTGAEWDAFIAGVEAGEFKYELLPSYASTLSTPTSSEGYDAGEVGSGSGVVAGSNLAATGAGAIAVPPVPVAAQPPLATVRCPECGNGVTAVIEALTVGSAWPKHYRKDVALGCSHWGMFHLIRPEHIEVPVPVAAQPVYILDKDAILDLAGRYAAACVEAATTGSPKGREDAREQIRDLWDAIRAALTPVPVVESDPFDAEADRVLRVYDELIAAKPGDMFAFDQAPGQRVAVVVAAFREPEPRWGAGPLVEHVPETHAGYPGSGLARCGAPIGAHTVAPGEKFTCRKCQAEHNPETPGTGSAVPDSEEIERRDRLAEPWTEDD